MQKPADSSDFFRITPLFQWKSLYWGHSNLGYFSNNRSNPLERFYKIWVLKGFANFTGKYMYHILLFIKLQAEDLQFYYKRNFRTSVFLWILQNLYRHLFYRTSLVDYFRNYHSLFCFFSCTSFYSPKFNSFLANGLREVD